MREEGEELEEDGRPEGVKEGYATRTGTETSNEEKEEREEGDKGSGGEHGTAASPSPQRWEDLGRIERSASVLGAGIASSFLEEEEEEDGGENRREKRKASTAACRFGLASIDFQADSDLRLWMLGIDPDPLRRCSPSLDEGGSGEVTSSDFVPSTLMEDCLETLEAVSLELLKEWEEGSSFPASASFGISATSASVSSRLSVCLDVPVQAESERDTVDARRLVVTGKSLLPARVSAYSSFFSEAPKETRRGEISRRAPTQQRARPRKGAKPLPSSKAAVSRSTQGPGMPTTTRTDSLRAQGALSLVLHRVRRICWDSRGVSQGFGTAFRQRCGTPVSPRDILGILPSLREQTMAEWAERVRRLDREKLASSRPDGGKEEKKTVRESGPRVKRELWKFSTHPKLSESNAIFAPTSMSESQETLQRTVRFAGPPSLHIHHRMTLREDAVERRNLFRFHEADWPSSLRMPEEGPARSFEPRHTVSRKVRERWARSGKGLTEIRLAAINHIDTFPVPRGGLCLNAGWRNGSATCSIRMAAGAGEGRQPPKVIRKGGEVVPHPPGKYLTFQEREDRGLRLPSATRSPEQWRQMVRRRKFAGGSPRWKRRTLPLSAGVREGREGEEGLVECGSVDFRGSWRFPVFRKSVRDSERGMDVIVES
uniref:Uncharacterized protein n=1 Tax=Chromera velia CCMP2878 TaxID=1169474 RepID=A0A0G4ID39_9ALVE|eukprot:Cvel_13268.t1-p1 / transcript=Cvel_13268.t1 / gene=Cvel_13268 / organism=Chromera_velia_CCMP2878 / gene_product=hypothetical protein / transcript_product=hypothetical protein / location=Cvel_scaffold900:2006-6543(+) / protein_length=656 / sequence_SO=supercontig / SO=protein_coding / is_pseudo=false